MCPAEQTRAAAACVPHAPAERQWLCTFCMFRSLLAAARRRPPGEAAEDRPRGLVFKMTTQAYTNIHLARTRGSQAFETTPSNAANTLIACSGFSA